MDKAIVDDIKDHVTDAIAGDAMDRETLSEFVDRNFDAAIPGLGEEFIEATVLCIVHLRKLGIKNIIVKSMNELRCEGLPIGRRN